MWVIGSFPHIQFSRGSMFSDFLYRCTIKQIHPVFPAFPAFFQKSNQWLKAGFTVNFRAIINQFFCRRTINYQIIEFCYYIAHKQSGQFEQTAIHKYAQKNDCTKGITARFLALPKKSRRPLPFYQAVQNKDSKKRGRISVGMTTGIIQAFFECCTSCENTTII